MEKYSEIRKRILYHDSEVLEVLASRLEKLVSSLSRNNPENQQSQRNRKSAVCPRHSMLQLH
jgi:hypothetical protein